MCQCGSTYNCPKSRDRSHVILGLHDHVRDVVNVVMF